MESNSGNEYLPTKSSWDYAVASILENYGWYLLILAIALFCAYRKAQPTINKYFKDKADSEYAAKYHKNPDLLAARARAQQMATERLQEKYAKDAAVYQQKMEDKEAKKREEWLARNQTSSGQKLGSSSTNNQSKSLKPESNPLMGGGSGYSYRPQRRSPCSGGGCGR